MRTVGRVGFCHLCTGLPQTSTVGHSHCRIRNSILKLSLFGVSHQLSDHAAWSPNKKQSTEIILCYKWCRHSRIKCQNVGCRCFAAFFPENEMFSKVWLSIIRCYTFGHCVQTTFQTYDTECTCSFPHQRNGTSPALESTVTLHGFWNTCFLFSKHHITFNPG